MWSSSTCAVFADGKHARDAMKYRMLKDDRDVSAKGARFAVPALVRVTHGIAPHR
jgi:hypothetical protein